MNSDQLLILKKPFDSIEVLQCAHTLTEKWTLGKLARTKIQGLEELMGSQLHVTSQVGKGSTFSFVLELGSPGERDGSPLAHPESERFAP